MSATAYELGMWTCMQCKWYHETKYPQGYIDAALARCSRCGGDILVHQSEGHSGVCSRASHRAAGSLGIHDTGWAACALHVYQLGAAPTHAQGVQGRPSAAARAVSIQPGARRAAAARDIHHARVAALVCCVCDAACARRRYLRMALLMTHISCICCYASCASCLHCCRALPLARFPSMACRCA